MNGVLITGGTGLVGSKLTKYLTYKNYSVSYISRKKNINASGIDIYQWRQKAPELEKAAFEKNQCIIHLAGENIGKKRWTKVQKKLLVESRLDSSEFLYSKLKENNHAIKTVISASAVGIYGDRGNDWVDENSDTGNGFLPDLCNKWEESVKKIQELGIRTVLLRIGLVLSHRGGAFPRIAKPIKYWAGAPIGSGTQYISWIHIDDLCGIIIKALEDTSMSGIYNTVTPNPVTNHEFTTMLANFMGKPLFMPNIPTFVFRLLFGEMSQILLDSIRVKPTRILETGFQYKYPTLDTALIRILKKAKERS